MNSEAPSLRLSVFHRPGRSALWREICALCTYALPVAGAQLANMGMLFSDTMMAGHLSATDLAAVAVGFSAAMPPTLFVIGVLMLANPIVGQLVGAGKHGEIGPRLWQFIYLALLLSVPAVLFATQGEWILLRAGIDPEVAQLGAAYLQACSFGWPLYFVFAALRFYNEGLGLVKTYTIIIVSALPLNVVANLVFMYGHLGFPAMGALGTGYASALVMVSMFVAMSLATWRQLRGKYDMRIRMPKMAPMREMLALGVPNGANLCMEVGMFAVMALFIGSMGTAQVGAHQIAINLASILYMIPLSVSIAVTIRTGHAAGKGDAAGMRLTGLAGVAVVLVCQVVLAGLMYLFSGPLASLYTTDPVVIQAAVHLLGFAALFQLSDGLAILATGGLRGLKDTRIPMMVSLVAYWLVGMPLGYYLAFSKGMGPSGFWLSMVVALSLSASLLNWRFYTLLKAYR